MAVFVIQTTEFLGDGRRRYVYLRTSHTGLEGLAADLRLGPVVGHQLKASLQDEAFVVRESRPLMITAAMVHHAYTPDYPFVDEKAGAA